MWQWCAALRGWPDRARAVHALPVRRRLACVCRASRHLIGSTCGLALMLRSVSRVARLCGSVSGHGRRACMGGLSCLLKDRQAVCWTSGGCRCTLLPCIWDMLVRRNSED